MNEPPSWLIAARVNLNWAGHIQAGTLTFAAFELPVAHTLQLDATVEVRPL
jgi:hypothetical protein